MAELREDSLLFSLETLMARERERVQLERAEAERQRALELAAAAAAEKQRLEAALARERELETERAEEQKRLLEHAAQLETLRQSEVMRAQVEAKARADSELRAQRHAHERNLAQLALAEKRSRDRAIALGSAGLLSLFVPTALLFHFAHTLPRARELETELRNLIGVERTRANLASEQLAKAETRRRELEAALVATQTSLSELRAQAAVSPRPGNRPSPAHGAVKPASASTGKPCRESGDPLDPCLR